MKNKKCSHMAHPCKRVLAVIILLLFVAGCNNTVQVPDENATLNSKATYIRMYYSRKAENDKQHDYTHMNLDNLDIISSSTYGTVVDAEDLTIDVVGAVFSVNTAEIFLRVTANQLESVLLDNGSEILCNYRFGDESAMLGIFTLNREFLYLGHEYWYCDTDDSLAPNQFILHYWIINSQPFGQNSFTIPLKDFGYFSNDGTLIPIYKGNWDIIISIDHTNQSGMIIKPDKDLQVGNYAFSVNDVQITPLACTIRMICQEETDVFIERQNDVMNSLNTELSSCEVILKNGSKLNRDCFTTVLGGVNDNCCYILIIFIGPISVDDVDSLNILGQAEVGFE